MVVLASAVLGGACRGDVADGTPPPNAAELDGSERSADVTGIVTAASRDGITIGGKEYDVHERLQSFSGQDLSALPLVEHIGQLSQAGLDGDTIVWIGSIGLPLPGPDGAPIVYVTAPVKEATAARVVFERGLVLRVKAGTTIPNVKGVARAEIDGRTGEVVALVLP